jgi:hypothetical protein
LRVVLLAVGGADIVTMFAMANAQECGRGCTLKIKY